jgi:hypothetical protein
MDGTTGPGGAVAPPLRGEPDGGRDREARSPGAGGGERDAARAYLRLLSAVRAALDDRPGSLPVVLPLPAGPLSEADDALCAAGLAGNEAAFLRTVAAQALGVGRGTPDA